MMRIVFIISIVFIFANANWDELLKDQHTQLQKTKYISLTYLDEKYSTGYSIIDIDKNIKTIWSQIKDFTKYPDRISSISKASIYKKTKDEIGVLFTFSKFFISKDSYFMHKLNSQKYEMTWELAENKPYGFFNYSKGIWMLEKISTNKTRVFYKNTIVTPKWLPSMLKNYLIKNASRDSVLWLLE